MIRVRHEQVLAIREILEQSFADELFVDASAYFPERTTFLGEAGTRAAIGAAMERAAAHDLQGKRGVAMYVTLTFIVGSHFGDNPLYPWARKILYLDREVDQPTRAHRLYNALRRHLRAVRDERRKYVEPILLFPEAQLMPSAPGLAGAALEARLVEVLKTVAPAHAQVAGDDRVRALIRLAVEHAAGHGIESASGLSIYVPLAFLLGIDFARDPQFPWAADALAPRRGDHSEDAARRLREAALVFRRHTLITGEQAPAQQG